MVKTTMNIVTRKNVDGSVIISNSFIYTPKTKFAGGCVKWYEDKYKNTKATDAS